MSDEMAHDGAGSGTGQDVTSSARVATDRPGRYGKQLAAHLSRRSITEWDESTGTGSIQFTGGRALLTAREKNLELDLVASDLEHLSVLEGVVGRHLMRFGSRDELVVQWVRADGSAGTRQQSATEGDDESSLGR